MTAGGEELWDKFSWFVGYEKIIKKLLVKKKRWIEALSRKHQNIAIVVKVTEKFNYGKESGELLTALQSDKNEEPLTK